MAGSPAFAAPIPNKISVYSDSTGYGHQGHLPRAARIFQRGAGKFSGYNDYTLGGNSWASNLIGRREDGNLVFGGLTFQQHINTVDDADIVIFTLGFNDVHTKRDGTVLESSSIPEDYIGSDGLTVAANAMMHIQYARAAGKRVVVVGTPFIDPVKMIDPHVGMMKGSSVGVGLNYINRTNITNTALRLVAAYANAVYGRVSFIAQYGAPVSVGQPAADASSTQDGIHPTGVYGDAVNDHLADRIIVIHNL
jgi:hypothetical protein